MSLSKISPALGDKIYPRKIDSGTEAIELDLVQSFPVGVQETIKQRRSNEFGSIKNDDGSKKNTLNKAETQSIFNNRIKIEVNSRTISSEAPETPSTGAVGRYWKWSDNDINRTSSISSMNRPRNVSITSTTSRDSSSSTLTDINPYISLIHSDSLRRQTLGSTEDKIEKSSDNQSKN